MPATSTPSLNGTVPPEIQRRIGFPWSPQMVERSRRSVGATIAAAHAALDDGVAANLAGGTHHAFADRGEGFCVFNDVAVGRARAAARSAARAGSPSSISTCTRATAPPRSSAATRRCSRSRCTARRTSRSRKKSAISTCRSPTAPVTTNTCRCCRSHLPDVLNRHQPDFVFYLAGADPFEGDRLGRLKMTIDGLRRRDEIVMEACTTARLAGRDLDERRLRQRHRRDRHHSRQYDSATACQGTMAQHFRLLTEQQVHSLLPMPDLIAAMESALAKFSAREVLQPVRSVLTVGPTKAYFGLMPAYVPVAGEPRRQARDGVRREPQAGPAVAPGDDPAARSGNRRAAGDHGRPLHHRGAHRGGVGGVDALSRRGPTPSTLAIIGSGVQARSHLEAYQLVRQLKQVRIWSPKPAQPRAVRRRHERRTCRFPIVAADSAEAAVRGADLIVLVTSSPTPVIEDAWVSKGAHVVCVGACRPNQQEMPPQLVTRSRSCTSIRRRRRRRRIRRHRDEHRREAVRRRRTFAARSASSCSAASRAAHRPTTSRCSSRSAWRLKMSSPPTSCFAAPRNPEQERS